MQHLHSAAALYPAWIFWKACSASHQVPAEVFGQPTSRRFVCRAIIFPTTENCLEDGGPFVGILKAGESGCAMFLGGMAQWVEKP